MPFNPSPQPQQEARTSTSRTKCNKTNLTFTIKHSQNTLQKHTKTLKNLFYKIISFKNRVLKYVNIDTMVVYMPRGNPCPKGVEQWAKSKYPSSESTTTFPTTAFCPYVIVKEHEILVKVVCYVTETTLPISQSKNIFNEHMTLYLPHNHH